MVTYSSWKLISCWLALRILAEFLTRMYFIFIDLAVCLLQNTAAWGDARGGWTVKT